MKVSINREDLNTVIQTYENVEILRYQNDTARIDKVILSNQNGANRLVLSYKDMERAKLLITLEEYSNLDKLKVVADFNKNDVAKHNVDSVETSQGMITALTTPKVLESIVNPFISVDPSELSVADVIRKSRRAEVLASADVEVTKSNKGLTFDYNGAQHTINKENATEALTILNNDSLSHVDKMDTLVMLSKGIEIHTKAAIGLTAELALMNRLGKKEDTQEADQDNAATQKSKRLARIRKSK